MKIIQSPKEMQNWSLDTHSRGQKIGFVCTMGALHEGHMALIREARNRCDQVVVSIFVNPLQFAPHEDFNAYPRTLESDSLQCKSAGVDILFCPRAADIYRDNFQTRVIGGELKTQYCGQTRPIFFDGVLTVVHILYQIVRPHVGFWGEKDFQQVYLVERMIKDFWVPAEIVRVPTIRESNGLARSSRNSYLTPEQQGQATCLFRGLLAASEAYQSGERDAEKLLKLAREKITLDIDYLKLVSEQTLCEIEGAVVEPARVLLAAYIGTNPRVRLIDNMAL